MPREMPMTSPMPPLVLVIDDAAEIRELVGHLLGDAGFRVATAPDGFQGFKKAAEDPPDVILMDFDLPGMDGVEATSHLRRNATTKNIPIIAYTGLSLVPDAARLQAKGFCDLVSKTSDSAGLVQAINRALHR
jgi:CheY-like chemotaxis protein